jgi:hypothetical protein
MVVVQFAKTIRIRARFSGVPQPVETPTRFSGYDGKRAALEPIHVQAHGRHR